MCLSSNNYYLFIMFNVIFSEQYFCPPLLSLLGNSIMSQSTPDSDLMLFFSEPPRQS